MKNIAYAISVMLLSSVLTVSLAQPPGTYGPGMVAGSPSSGSFNFQRGMRFERDRDQAGYHLRIHLQGISPDAIQVNVQGHSLVVENRESQQIERRSDRGRYQFSSTSSSMRRRFSLPPDADVGALQRSDEEGVIVITLPYVERVRY
jgi:HSP20 family molecular chaperone IbpA